MAPSPCRSCTAQTKCSRMEHQPVRKMYTFDHSPCLMKAGECWADVAHASQPRGTAPIASSGGMGALVVGPTPQACIAVGPMVYPAVYHTGGRGRGGCFLPCPEGLVFTPESR